MDETESTNTDEAEEMPIETIDVPIPVDDFHHDLLSKLGNEAQVLEVLGANLQPDTEDLIHSLYQEGKFER